MKILLHLIFLCLFVSGFGQNVQTLRSNKTFVHENAAGGNVKLLKNTEAVLYADGKVKFGTLAENCKLAFAYGSENYAEFQLGTPVSFFPTGLVNSGTLVYDTPFRYTYDNEVKIVFAANTKITFDANGLVICGTLAIDTEIPISDEAVKKFKSNTIFNVSDLGND
ncbi:MAG TPA: hypothetical protein DCQ31_03805 [Bacteroidales bacterium]|nr:hypothetical protein [Bacteroidales bacterium]